MSQADHEQVVSFMTLPVVDCSVAKSRLRVQLLKLGQ